MKSLVIFDLDGTLINSIYDLADAVNEALLELGYPTHEVEKFYHFVGDGTLKLCERALPADRDNEAEVLKLHEIFAKNYNTCCMNKTKPYDDIIKMLKVIKGKGISCAVASNKTDEFVKIIVSEIFPKGIFDVVMGKKESVPAKPCPQIVDNIINELGFDRDSCIYVGDSDVDVITAHNAKIKCIGCTWGFRGEKELISIGADYLAHTPMEIIDYL